MSDAYADHDRLNVIVHAVMEAKILKDYAKVNEVFDELTMQDTEFRIVGYLRSTFSIRSKVLGWQPTLVRAYDELNRRGHDAARMLRGLF